MNAWLQDLRHAVRMLRKSPLFTAVAVATLGVGIGTNAVIFTGAYWVLFEELPYPEPDSLAVLYQVDKAGAETGVSHIDFVEWRTGGSDLLQEAGASRTQGVTLEGRDDAERVTVGIVSSEVMPMLGARALLGRTLGSADHVPGTSAAVVLGHAFWQARFGSDTGVIGRRLRLDGRECTVVGVMPPGFSYPFRAALWLPLEAWEAPAALQDASRTAYDVLVRLRGGVSPAAAAERAAQVARRMPRPAVAGERELTVRAARLRETLPSIGKLRRTILVLQLAVALVLLIACLNLANLVLARNVGRRQELAVRVALGGRPGRLVRLLLAESLLLGVLGTFVGLLLARWGVDALRTAIVWRPAGLPEAGLNLTVLWVMLAVGVGTSVLVGLLPARLATRFDLASQLKLATGQTTAHARGRRSSRALVVAEAALAVVLLAVAGATLRTLADLARFDGGFDSDSAIVVSYTVPADTSREGVLAHYTEVLQRLTAVPGIEAAGGISFLPLIGYNPEVDVEIAGRASTGQAARPRARFQAVTPDYFAAMGIPMVSGTRLAAADMRPVPEAVIVNRSFARRYLGPSHALGQRLQLFGTKDVPGPLTVVGVVENVRPFFQDEEPPPEIYVPACRASMSLIARARGPAAEQVPAVRSVLREAARRQAAFTVTTMPQMMADGRARRYVFAWLLAGMAAVALLLTALGIYGVVSHDTARRTREIGVRMALGADASSVRRLVLGQGLSLAAAGIGCGALGAFAMMRVMRRLPFRLVALDPLLLGAVGLGVMAVVVAACLLPARRAARVEPIEALRCE